LVTYLPDDQGVGRLSSRLAHPGEQMRVRVGRRPDRGVTQHLGHDRDVDPGGQHQRRPAVAQVVQADLPDSGFPGDLHELLGHVVRMPRVAVDVGEHQVVLGVRVTPLCPLAVLGEPVAQQGTERGLPEVDAAGLAVGGLRRAEQESAVDAAARLAGRVLVGLELGGHELLTDHEEPVLEVYVTPPQAQGLTAAEAGHRHQLEDDAERVRAGVVEEPAELLTGPGVDLRAMLLRDGGVGGRVVADQALPAGVAQRGGQYAVDPARGGGPDASCSVRCGDLAVHVGQVPGLQVPEPQVPDVGAYGVQPPAGVAERGRSVFGGLVP